jgi:hypothetical protein
MNANTAHIARLVTLTRDMYSTEQTIFASQDSNRMLARTLSRQLTLMQEARLRIVEQAMRSGIDWKALMFVCQHATDAELVDLYCDRTDDAGMLAMIADMTA